MRNLMFVAALTLLAAPAMAQDSGPVDPKNCYGEPFEINGKKVCFVLTNPDDYYRVVDKKDEPRPRFKLSGHLMANDMATTRFSPETYTYGGDRSVASLKRNDPGWGLSGQWSPNDVLWIELGWQRPPQLSAQLDTVQLDRFGFYRCGREVCAVTVEILQANKHVFKTDDFSLALKWEVGPSNQYYSVLLGAGIHRRYIRNHVDIATAYHEDWRNGAGNLAFAVVTDETRIIRTDKATQTRLFWQADFELYPAGKDKSVGLGVSTRFLSDGDREQTFSTDTLLDRTIDMSLEPGNWDVTARLILRF